MASHWTVGEATISINGQVCGFAHRVEVARDERARRFAVDIQSDDPTFTLRNAYRIRALLETLRSHGCPVTCDGDIVGVVAEWLGKQGRELQATENALHDALEENGYERGR